MDRTSTDIFSSKSLLKKAHRTCIWSHSGPNRFVKQTYKKVGQGERNGSKKFIIFETRNLSKNPGDYSMRALGPMSGFAWNNYRQGVKFIP